VRRIMMKLLSLEIETTGLSPSKHDVLEVGMVWDDLSCKEQPLQAPFRAVVVRETYRISPFWVIMHKGIFDDIDSLTKTQLGELEGVGYIRIENTFYCKERFLIKLMHEWLVEQGMTGTLNLAGRNLEFYLKFLDYLCYKRYIYQFPCIIDPAILYYEKGDECLPDITQCIQRAKRDGADISTAVSDAQILSELVRFSLDPDFRR